MSTALRGRDRISRAFIGRSSVNICSQLPDLDFRDRIKRGNIIDRIDGDSVRPSCGGIVTAGGKNIAPQPIENLLKTHPLVEQVVLIGDRRRYCSLIVVPAFEALKQWAEDHGIDSGSEGALVEHPEVVAGVGDELLAMLGDLASFERPKKVALLGEELTVENGLMTPTLKVKRRQLEQRFAALIDSLYEDEAADKTAR